MFFFVEQNYINLQLIFLEILNTNTNIFISPKGAFWNIYNVSKLIIFSYHFLNLQGSNETLATCKLLILIAHRTFRRKLYILFNYTEN